MLAVLCIVRAAQTKRLHGQRGRSVFAAMLLCQGIVPDWMHRQGSGSTWKTHLGELCRILDVLGLSCNVMQRDMLQKILVCKLLRHASRRFRGRNIPTATFASF